MDEPRFKIDDTDDGGEQQWVDACKQMEAAIVEYYGTRCDEYVDECKVCKQWRLFDELRGIDATDIDEPTDVWEPT